MADPQKSENYVLLIDKQRSSILAAFIETVINAYGAKTVFDLLLKQYGVEEGELRSFVEDISNKEHDLKWCTDPNCKHVNTRT